jgi:hypothetical protein
VQVFNYPKFLGMTHAKGRDSVSDHAPIFLSANFSGGSLSTASAQPRPALPNPMKPAVTANNGAKNLTVAIRGNKKTMVYHRPDCPSYNAISEKNRVEFDTAAAAEAQHYHLAGNCH